MKKKENRWQHFFSTSCLCWPKSTKSSHYCGPLHCFFTVPELTAAWRTKITLHSSLLRVNPLTNFTVFYLFSWQKRNVRSTLRIIHCCKASFIRARTTDYLKKTLVPGMGNLPSSCWPRETKKLPNQYRLMLFLVAT